MPRVHEMTKAMPALFAIAELFAAVPAIAGNMGAHEASHFVIGNLFSFTCLEGTSGEARVYADGSVEGEIRLRGSGSPQHATLPAGTIRVRGDAVCALIAGMSFEACFELDRTGPKGFRVQPPPSVLSRPASLSGSQITPDPGSPFRRPQAGSTHKTDVFPA